MKYRSILRVMVKQMRHSALFLAGLPNNRTSMPADRPSQCGRRAHERMRPRVRLGLEWACWLSLSIFIGVQSAHSQPVGPSQLAPSNGLSVTFTPDPKDTQTAIGGTLSGDTATLSRVQAVYVEVLNGVGDHADVVQGPLDAKYSASTYSFTASNLKPLAEGQYVHVHVCGTPIPVSFKGTTRSGSAVITNVTSSTPLVAGGGISGSGIPAGSSVASVDSSSQITISQNATADGTEVGLQFTNGLSCSQAGPQNASGGNTAKAALVEIIPTNPAIQILSLYDLGRVKAYFSVGAEFQGTNGTLGSTSGFVGVNIDENWFTSGAAMSGLCPAAGETNPYQTQISLQNQGQGRRACGVPQSRLMINTYTDAELTQIPLTSSTSQSAGGTPSSSQDLRAMAATSSGSPTSSNSASSSSFDISKAKGAYVEGGVYAPIVPSATQWTFRGQANGFFVAPMGKYIFLEPDTTPAGTTTNFNAYRAYAGGFRIGHFRLPSRFDKQNPELLSFLDLTWGKWENFREADGSRGARFDAKGRYKIPYTLLYIGFEANVGPGGSDFRLFAGTRVDISTILGKLLPSTN